MATKKFLDSTGVGHLYARLKTLIENSTNDSVKSIANAVQSDNVFTVTYTTVKGEEKTFTLTIPYATSTAGGLMSKDHVGSLAKKVEAIKINDTAMTVADGTASGSFTFGLDNGNIVLKFGSTTIGTVPTASFVVDGMLEDAELVTVAEADVNDNTPTAGKYIKLTFNADAKSKEVYVNVTDLIDIYVAQKGEASKGNYVTITPTLSGDGSKGNPWVIGATVDDAALKTKIDNIDASIDSLNSTIEGIVSVGGEANKVDDVTVDGTSIVTNKVAKLVSASTTANGLMTKEQVANLNDIYTNGITSLAKSVTAGVSSWRLYIGYNSNSNRGSIDFDITAATTTTSGVMSASDKTKLDSLEAMEALTNDEIDALLA